MFKFTRTTIVLIAIVQLIPGCSSITPSASRAPQYPIAIKPQFDYASDFHEGLAAIRAGDKWGYIDKQGGIVIKPRFDEVGDFSNGLARVRMGTKWGYIDSQATTISTPRFDEAFDFSDGLARVRTGNKWGYIGVNGALLIERKYQDAGDFHEGLAAVKVENAWGYINKDGTIVINPVLHEANPFSDGLALVRLQNGWGPKAYIAKNGNIEIDLRKSEGHAFHEGLARKDGANYINAQGKEVIYAGYLKPVFFLGGDFHEGLARVSVRLPTGVRDGFIDQKGNYVIQPAFDDAGDFSEGFAAIKKDGKWGYIDKQGSIIIEPQFDYASDFHGGLARVEIGFKWGFIKPPLSVLTEEPKQTGIYSPLPFFKSAKHIDTSKTIRTFYPREARIRGICGDVRIALSISSSGEITDKKIIYSDHPEVFDSAVEKYIESWKFEQKFVNGTAIPYQTLVPIKFRLGPDDKCQPKP